MAVAGLPGQLASEEQLDTADLHGAVARRKGKCRGAPERERAITIPPLPDSKDLHASEKSAPHRSSGRRQRSDGVAPHHSFRALLPTAT